MQHAKMTVGNMVMIGCEWDDITAKIVPEMRIGRLASKGMTGIYITQGPTIDFTNTSPITNCETDEQNLISLV